MDFSEDKRLRERLELAECIARRMAGTASEEERRTIDSWVAGESGNAERMEAIYKQVVKEGKAACPDLEGRWKDFEKRVGYRKLGRRRYSWIAAVLVLPICITCYLYFQVRPETASVIPVAEEVIVPGMNRALLILSDGKTVDLERTADSSLHAKNGAEVLMSGERLQYKADSARRDVEAYHTLVVPVGGEYSIVLSDNSRVWLNAGSRLRYPVAFADSVRRVELEGEGFFEVSRDAERPFIVRVAGADVKVLGTAFNVSAYDNSLVATLVEGRIVLSKVGEQVVLRPNQQACWSETEGFAVRKVDARNYALWKEGVFWFADVDLEAIMERLARWYDLEVCFMGEELKGMRFSLEVKRYHDIEDILRKIAYTRKVRFTIEGRKLMVMK